ncbi:MAG: ABC transporter [Candidatus Nealsonbacteria bacterium RIFCSPLOWO2_12_FULL_39_31]|uniref:ABC transporter n=3 Tax=Candidatus Nealsoniibacteriota TaxID=1817911 RepID=A0A1G2EKA2_9BACT|nr:MAG: ABC-3 protein [Parcubacteria group bacterium GW2011_GWA2_38_27]KKQ97308.1 MAG: ABC-3 protein [Parcubacteria group bacterium GW2011_GWC2_39_11]OGZ19422.1 MAG: ABC transporter [Candidatus Nealsonbacteria bacterium RIFCSPHIGHO2_01_FULL_38_55]OGZ20780.1 MAG: ABC transporter [Candidatus Nealsonbacteria bacterium RIFCSPHIGHO2_02_38_10]OGZ21693.1 MAG: ABC transporter [Candidatus Nealsonbacteria bacterium RIFCSPHIGHO2_02_FULL_38_75]OGZ22400.1 MAG: ABC transporter [Candidatus Nealsonbacteria ba
MTLLNFLEYGFIQRAYIAGSFIAVLCAMLGLFLVLRKLSLIGDGLSHASFGAIALGLFFGIYPFYIAIPIVLLSSLLIVWISEKAKIYGDAAIGIVSSVGIAGGVILASVSNGFNVDLFSYLFGNILSISRSEVFFSIALSVLVLLAIWFFYQDLFSVTFDETFAKATGIKTNLVNIILTSLTAITVVLAIKVVGIMLVSALLILPAVSALQISKGFKGALFVSVLFAVISVLIGITASFFLDIPAGATIVIVNFLIFSLSFLGKIILR